MSGILHIEESPRGDPITDPRGVILAQIPPQGSLEGSEEINPWREIHGENFQEVGTGLLGVETRSGGGGLGMRIPGKEIS